MSTPNRPTKKTSSSTQSNKSGQKSILGFFQKKVDAKPVSSNPLLKKATTDAAHRFTPAPSSDALEPPSSAEQDTPRNGKNKENGLLTPITPDTIGSRADAATEGIDPNAFSSPIRKVSLLSISIPNLQLTPCCYRGARRSTTPSPMMTNLHYSK